MRISRNLRFPRNPRLREKQCKLPPTVVLALLFRGADVIPPAGTTVLIPGDVVVAIVNPKGLKDIEPLFPK